MKEEYLLFVTFEKQKIIFQKFVKKKNIYLICVVMLICLKVSVTLKKWMLRNEFNKIPIYLDILI